MNHWEFHGFHSPWFSHGSSELLGTAGIFDNPWWFYGKHDVIWCDPHGSYFIGWHVPTRHGCKYYHHQS